MDSSLLTPGILDEAARLAFKCGACGALAIAIHDATEWPIVAIIDQNGSVLHWTVRRADGMLIDIEGGRTQEELIAEYTSEIDDGGQASVPQSFLVV